MTNRVPILAVLSLFAMAAGCGGGSGTSNTAASPAASAQTSAPAASPSTQASAETSPTASGATATPEPTPTPDSNLLSWKNGAIVRSYSQQLGSTPDVNDFIRGFSYPDTFKGPAVFVYELPGPTAIASFAAELPAAQPSAAPAKVTFAVSATGKDGDYKDAATLAATNDSSTPSANANVTARWIRVTSEGPPFNSIALYGTTAALPAGVSPAGIYLELNQSPAKDGAFTSVTNDTDPWYRRVATQADAMIATRCFNGHYGNTYAGTLDGRVWSYVQGESNPGRVIVNDDASMLVGNENGAPVYLMRSSNQPKYCEPLESGSPNGKHVLVLDATSPASIYPVDENLVPGYSYTRIGAGMLDSSFLAGTDMAIMNSLCDTSQYLAKGQTDALMAWVTAGHKLLIVDSDVCAKSAYAFLPYTFTTSNPGANGASGDRLIVVESDALGTTDKNDAEHYFDPKAYLNNGSNQLGDANVVTTQDPHWCGHLFGTNVKKDNGFMQMYAPVGQGMVIYDGFDHDDGGNPGYRRVRDLEFALPLPAGMPCTQSVALAFLIQPNQEATFTSGTAATIKAPMETLANLGWSGHVTITTTGDFPATVTPNSFDMAGGTQPLDVSVSIPASAKPGAYTVNVVGTGNDGKTSQASITLTGTAPLKKVVIQKHQRIRIYGIHFDYDSAHIQPRSEPVIAQIAALMKQNPAWHFEVSGHTDSDGGPAYNLGLSQRRAQSVVNDLVTRYGIARSRLVAKGYGLTRPVATNSTEAGKALNRRVELERLQ